MGNTNRYRGVRWFQYSEAKLKEAAKSITKVLPKYYEAINIVIIKDKSSCKSDFCNWNVLHTDVRDRYTCPRI